MKTCTKCKNDLEEQLFYKGKSVCKDCFKSYVTSRRPIYVPKETNLEPIPETIKTVPWKSQVNHELYQHLLRL